MTDAKLRQRIWVTGKIRSLCRKSETDVSNLECEISDGTGSLLLVFQGRRRIPGIAVGALVRAEGMVGSWRRHLAILNPDYELVCD
jgi:hypothetical protein